ncbi:MAG TPA: PKD domain-containing protein [Phycisphaerae bacterium]|nr:PKD domain-containing protein [Phycisphaerae bacterium]
MQGAGKARFARRWGAVATLLLPVWVCVIACEEPPSVEPAPPSPIAILASTESGAVPLEVEFAAYCPDDTPLPDGLYAWDFGDDTVGEGPLVRHTYTEPGWHTVRLCVTTVEGDELPCDTVAIHALEPPPDEPEPPSPPANEEPIAVADVDATSPVEGTLVTLDGTGSYDPDGGPQSLTYAWTQTAGESVTGDPQFDPNAAQPQFTAPAYTGDPQRDELTFSLTAYDGADYSDPDTVTITVTRFEPPPDQRTADMPDSWLVLYNLNHADSVAWKDWYLAQWDIRTEHALGLDADPNLERIHKDDFRDDIFLPVRDYLDGNPDIAARIMGILVGYRVPGNFYQDANTPIFQGGGGWSVACKLQDLDPNNLDEVRTANPHYFSARLGPVADRLTKATLAVDTYLTARIDAPTLDDAKALTLRAQAIRSATDALPAAERLYYDYLDVGAAGGDEWGTLRLTVEDVDFNDPAWRFPWQAFESDGAGEQPTPNCALRFCYYRLTGWNLADFSGTPAGTRILGFALNSWGATTVRSTTDHDARYVPNALVNGGFAAAIGATAEPTTTASPKPSTIVWCLAEGRTTAEAFFHSNYYTAWMWELTGDPLLLVPRWFEP